MSDELRAESAVIGSLKNNIIWQKGLPVSAVISFAVSIYFAVKTYLYKRQNKKQ